MDLIDTQSPRQALLSEGSYRSPSPQKSNDKSFIQPWDDEENSYEYSSSRAGKSPVQTKEKKERSNNNSPLGHAYHRSVNTDPGTPGNPVGSRDFDDTLHKLRKISKNREEVIGHHHDRKSRKDLDSKEEDIGKTLQMQQREEELSKQQTANNIMELDNNFNRHGNSEVAGQTALNSLIYQSQHGSEIYFIDELRLYIDKDEAAECMRQGSSRGQVPAKKVSAPLVMTQSNIKTGIMKAYNMYDHVVDDYGTPNIGNKEGISSSTVVYHGGKQHSMGHISMAKSPLIQIPVDMSKSIKTMESSPINGLDAINMAYSYTRTDRANRGSMGNKDDLSGNKSKVKPLMFPEINPKKRHNTHTSVSIVPQPTSYDIVRDDPGSEYYGSPNKVGSQHFPSSNKGNKESVDSFKGFKAPGKGSFSVMYKRGKKIRKALELRDGSGDQPQYLPPIVDTVKSAAKSDMKMCFESIVNGTERFEYGISKEKDARFFKEVDTTGQLKRSPLLKVIQRQVEAGNKEDNLGHGIGKKTLGHSIQKGNVRNKGGETGNKGSLKALPMKDLWESDAKLMEKKVRHVFHLAATPTAAMVKGQQNKRL